MIELQTVTEKICTDLVAGVQERGHRKFIATTFLYPDGDVICIYPNGQYLSDMGQTIYKLKEDGIDADSERRQDIIDSICALYDVEEKKGVIRKKTSDQSMQSDFRLLCEAIIRISSIYYDAPSRKHVALFHKLSDAIAIAAKEAQRTVDHAWYASFDSDKHHPVDFHINTKGHPRHVFFASSIPKAEEISGTVWFLRAKGLEVRTATVIDNRLSVPHRRLERLEEVSEVMSGVEESLFDVSEFVKGLD